MALEWANNYKNDDGEEVYKTTTYGAPVVSDTEGYIHIYYGDPISVLDRGAKYELTWDFIINTLDLMMIKNVKKKPQNPFLSNATWWESLLVSKYNNCYETSYKTSYIYNKAWIQIWL